MITIKVSKLKLTLSNGKRIRIVYLINNMYVLVCISMDYFVQVSANLLFINL